MGLISRLLRCWRGANFAGAVFDMDGTLVDSEMMHCRAYQQVVASLGKDLVLTEEEYDQFTGATDAMICAYIINRDHLAVSAQELLAQKERLFHEMLSGPMEPLPGVVKTLESLKKRGLKIAVASSSTKESIEVVLKSLNLRHFFDAIASGEEVENSKPAPDVFLLAARRLGVSPNRCLAFEDSENGTIAASRAGMYCIAIPCGSTIKQNHAAAKLKLASMSDLDLNALLQKRS
jgi:beta-phosphoglucomutase family hydrolase